MTGLPARIRLARKTIAEDFIALRTLYQENILDHRTLYELYDWTRDSPSWDTPAFVVSTHKALLLEDSHIKPVDRKILATKIDAINLAEPASQRKICEVVRDVALPFDWASFLIRRICLTFSINITS